MREGVTRIKLDCSAKLSFARSEIPVSPNLGEGEGAMCLSERVVQRNCFGGCGKGAALSLPVGQQRILVQQQIGVSQPCIGMSAGRIMDDGLSEVVERSIQTCSGSLVPLKAALEIEVLSQNFVGLGDSRG